MRNEIWKKPEKKQRSSDNDIYLIKILKCSRKSHTLHGFENDISELLSGGDTKALTRFFFQHERGRFPHRKENFQV